jgi:hypothetical protein
MEVTVRFTRLILSGAVFAAYAFIAGGASATTITFGGLAGPNGSLFTTYTEGGFTVTPTVGEWFQGQNFGNPIPSIVAGGVFGGPAVDSISVTGSAGTFTFSSLDFAPSPVGNVAFTFTGTLGGLPVFSIPGTLTPPQVFATHLSGVSADVIDDLVVGVTLADTSNGASVNIDNIVVAAVATPEPMTLGLLATGLALLGLAHRRSTS